MPLRRRLGFPGAGERDTGLFIVGSGLSSAFGIPNTPELLDEVSTTHGTWAFSQDLGDRTEEVHEYSFPIETGADSGFSAQWCRFREPSPLPAPPLRGSLAPLRRKSTLIASLFL